MLGLRQGTRLKMHGNTTIIRSILTEHRRFSRSFRTVTIKAVWTSRVQSGEKTIFLRIACFSCTFFCSANKEAVARTAQSIELAVSQLDLLFSVWGIYLTPENTEQLGRARGEQMKGWRERTRGLAKKGRGNCLKERKLWWNMVKSSKHMEGCWEKE